jgi:hypothetical protein
VSGFGVMAGQAENITRSGFLLGICIPSTRLQLLLIQIKSLERRHGIFWLCIAAKGVIRTRIECRDYAG